MTIARDILPFADISVTVAPDRSKVIQWDMNPLFRSINTIVGFHVELSRGGEWTRLTDTLVLDCLYLDTDSLRCGLRDDIYYRVVAVDSGNAEYNSVPVHIFNCWKNKEQWLIARDIIRKEYVRLQKLPTGVAGTLLKRRQHGPKCTSCTDYDTEQVVNESCDICYGTGFIGGYYNAVPYYMDLSGTASKEVSTADMGVLNNKQRIARAVAFPLVAEKDIWIAGKTNKRFIINKWETTAETLMIPLVLRITMSEISMRDVAYKIPAEQDMASIYEDTTTITGDSLDEDITKNTVW